MWNALNNAMNDHQTMNTFITLMAGFCGTFGIVALYLALTYDREVVLARLRRKR